jgi:D-alanyl-D-alanine carboxypeptidase (penicillin-binding protein 5/6)
MPDPVTSIPLKKPILRRHVPAWAVILLVVLAACGYWYFRTVTYSYILNTPGIGDTTSGLVYGATPALANADYYNQVRGDFVAQKASFVDADLSAMRLRVYKDGGIAAEVPIETKGREGSWWETPAGLYKIELKEPNHFSSIGHVYQPWSMVFQGNFFIHGWPYDADGTPVSSAFSGGCIRLTTENAKIVYDLVSAGMPVLVYEKDFTADAFKYPQKQPTVAATEYLVADIRNNAILAEKGITEVVPIASVTKLVTSLVAAEYIDLDKTIAITPEMLVTTSKPRLSVGQKITVYNLLFPLLMESSNEAAEAVARTLGRNYFTGLMNAKAKAINMQHTKFVDASGAGDGNVSSAEDLFSLLKYIYNNRSFVLNISAGKLSGSAYGESFYKDLQNFNKVPDVTAKFVGGKIGKTTAAEETYVGIFNETIAGEVRPIAVIILHSPDVYADVRALLAHVEETYR